MFVNVYIVWNPCFLLRIWMEIQLSLAFRWVWDGGKSTVQRAAALCQCFCVDKWSVMLMPSPMLQRGHCWWCVWRWGSITGALAVAPGWSPAQLCDKWNPTWWQWFFLKNILLLKNLLFGCKFSLRELGRSVGAQLDPGCENLTSLLNRSGCDLLSIAVPLKTQTALTAFASSPVLPFMKRKCCCWLARNPRLQGSEELNAVIPGLQNSGPAVALLIHAECRWLVRKCWVSWLFGKARRLLRLWWEQAPACLHVETPLQGHVSLLGSGRYDCFETKPGNKHHLTFRRLCTFSNTSAIQPCS